MSTFDKLVDFVDNSKLKYVPVGATEFVDLVSQVWNGGFQQYILNDYHSDVGSVVYFLKKINGESSKKLVDIIDRVDFDRISINDVHEDEELEETLEEMTDSFYEIDKAVVDEVYQHLIKNKAEAKTKFANTFPLGAAAFERFKNKSQYEFEKSDDDHTLILVYDGNKHIATFDTSDGSILTDLDKKVFASTEKITGYIVKVDVEKEGGIRFVGPFRNERAAKHYCEEYHGDLDKTEIFPLYSGLG